MTSIPKATPATTTTTTTTTPMFIPPVSPGTRSLSFQGASTFVHYRRLVFDLDDLGNPHGAGGGSAGNGSRSGKGKARAEPGPSPSSGERNGRTIARLDGLVKSTWKQGRSPELVGFVERSHEIKGQNQARIVYWVFGLGEDGLRRVDDDLSLEDPMALSGSFDLQTLTTCMHGASRPQCTLCGPLGRTSDCARQPGQGTRPSEIFVGLNANTSTHVTMTQGTGAEAVGFGKIWECLGNALVDYYAWTEGWMAERLARLSRGKGKGEQSQGPTMSILGREHQTGLDLEVYLSTREWEESPDALGTIVGGSQSRWDRSEEAEVGRMYRLWPSDEQARYIRRIELDQVELEMVLARIADQVGMKTAERLREEEDWTLLWIREDLPRARDLGGTSGTGAGTETGRIGEKGWYSVWPRSWLVDPYDPAKITSRRSSSANRSSLSDNWTSGPVRPAESVAKFLTALRSDRSDQPPQEAQVTDFDILNDDLDPKDGLRSLFDTQSWLDYDPVLDMASDMADTPVELGAPTPMGRTETDQNVAPINHDSVDAISSKILSPTANPTPAAQRDWDMMNTAYEMTQDEDVITENDFNFFDAPHTSMFDAFDDGAKNDDMGFGNNDAQAKGDLEQSGYGGKEQWAEAAAEMDPEPAPPYAYEMAGTAYEAQSEQNDVVPHLVPNGPASEVMDHEDESDDLFGEKEDESEEHTSAEEDREVLETPAADRESEPNMQPDTPVSVSPLNTTQHTEGPLIPPELEMEDLQGSPTTRRLCDLTDARYTIEDAGHGYVPAENRPLKWITAKRYRSQRGPKRLATYLAETYGDGLIKDRKGHRARLQKAFEARRRLRPCRVEDFPIESDESSEDESTVQGTDESWVRYQVDTSSVQTKRALDGPVRITERFDLAGCTWTCPDMIPFGAHQRLSSVLPLGLHPLKEVLPTTNAEMAPASNHASSIKQTFREWLVSLIVEDSALRDCLLGVTRPQERLPRSQEPGDVRIRLGHCGRSTVMDGNSIRFWRQLGLTPLSGQKDMSTFVLFDSLHTTRAEAVGWHTELNQIYTAQGFGRSVKMDESLFDSTLDLRWQNLQATLDMIGRRRLQLTPTVIIVLLRDEFSTNVNVLQDLYDHYAAIYPATTAAKIILQPAFLDRGHDSSSKDRLASCIYHRIPASHTSPFETVTTSSTVSLYAPAFTLCSTKGTPAARFAVQWPGPTTNPYDTGRMIHVGYTLTPSNALTAICMEEYGEWWTFEHIQVGTDSQALYQGIEKLWRRIRAYAANATVEWRFIIARLDQCRHEELRCWLSIIEKTPSARPAQFALVQLVTDSVQNQAKRGVSVQRVFCAPYTLNTTTPTPAAISLGSFPLRDDTERHEPPEVQLLLASTTAQSTICQTDKELLEDIGSSYQKLCRLGNLRWAFSCGRDFPAHIQALNTYLDLNLV